MASKYFRAVPGYDNCRTCGLLRPNGEDGKPEVGSGWEKEHDEHCKEPKWTYVPTHFEMLVRIEKLEKEVQTNKNVIADMGAARQHNKALEERVLALDVALNKRMDLQGEQVREGMVRLGEKVEALEAEREYPPLPCPPNSGEYISDEAFTKGSARSQPPGPEPPTPRGVPGRGCPAVGGHGITPTIPEPEGMKGKPKKEEPIGLALKDIEAGEPLTKENFQPADPSKWMLLPDGSWGLDLSFHASITTEGGPKEPDLIQCPECKHIWEREESK